MKRRKLGTLEVSEMGFGCMNASGNSGPAPDKNQGIGVIRAAHQKGVTLFDTAEASAKTIRRAHAVQPVSAVQTEYSIMNRDVEQNGVLKTCGELGIGFVPWGPMGQGYLTAKIDARTKFDPKNDTRSEFPRFSPENIAANMPIVDFLRQFSEKKNATPVQISLAWLLARKPFIVPIPGTRSVDHLNENLRAIDVQLTPADLREIETALSKIEG